VVDALRVVAMDGSLLGDAHHPGAPIAERFSRESGFLLGEALPQFPMRVSWNLPPTVPPWPTEPGEKL